MSSPDPVPELIQCTRCKAEYFVSDLDFPEPGADTNTQFGWLVANCPACGEDLKVGMDKISSLLD